MQKIYGRRESREDLKKLPEKPDEDEQLQTQTLHRKKDRI